MLTNDQSSSKPLHSSIRLVMLVRRDDPSRSELGNPTLLELLRLLVPLVPPRRDGGRHARFAIVASTVHALLYLHYRTLERPALLQVIPVLVVHPPSIFLLDATIGGVLLLL
jgi:hypothetical protein